MSAMETERSEFPITFDLLLKSIFDQSGKELLKALGFIFRVENPIDFELAELG